MKIYVKRTGGFAGLSEEVAAVDTANLDPAAVQELERMLESIRFFELPALVSPETVGADMFRYEIAMTGEDRQHTVVFYDDGSPRIAPLCSLVDTLAGMK